MTACLIAVAVLWVIAMALGLALCAVAAGARRDRD